MARLRAALVAALLAACAGGQSLTPSPSTSPSESASVSCSATTTASVTPSLTRSPSRTRSATRSSSRTPSRTPSKSDTPSPSPSRSETPSLTPSPSMTPSITPSSTATPSNTPSNTPSVSITPSITPSFKPLPPLVASLPTLYFDGLDSSRVLGGTSSGSSTSAPRAAYALRKALLCALYEAVVSSTGSADDVYLDLLVSGFGTAPGAEVWAADLASHPINAPATAFFDTGAGVSGALASSPAPWAARRVALQCGDDVTLLRTLSEGTIPLAPSPVPGEADPVTLGPLQLSLVFRAGSPASLASRDALYARQWTAFTRVLPTLRAAVSRASALLLQNSQPILGGGVPVLPGDPLFDERAFLSLASSFLRYGLTEPRDTALVSPSPTPTRTPTKSMSRSPPRGARALGVAAPAEARPPVAALADGSVEADADADTPRYLLSTLSSQERIDLFLTTNPWTRVAKSVEAAAELYLQLGVPTSPSPTPGGGAGVAAGYTAVSAPLSPFTQLVAAAGMAAFIAALPSPAAGAPSASASPFPVARLSASSTPGLAAVLRGSSGDSGLSDGAIAGIVVGSVAGAVLLAFVMKLCCRYGAMRGWPCCLASCKPPPVKRRTSMTQMQQVPPVAPAAAAPAVPASGMMTSPLWAVAEAAAAAGGASPPRKPAPPRSSATLATTGRPPPPARAPSMTGAAAAAAVAATAAVPTAPAPEPAASSPASSPQRKPKRKPAPKPTDGGGSIGSRETDFDPTAPGALSPLLPPAAPPGAWVFVPAAAAGGPSSGSTHAVAAAAAAAAAAASLAPRPPARPRGGAGASGSPSRSPPVYIVDGTSHVASPSSARRRARVVLPASGTPGAGGHSGIHNGTNGGFFASTSAVLTMSGSPDGEGLAPSPATVRPRFTRPQRQGRRASLSAASSPQAAAGGLAAGPFGTPYSAGGWSSDGSPTPARGGYPFSPAPVAVFNPLSTAAAMATVPGSAGKGGGGLLYPGMLPLGARGPGVPLPPMAAGVPSVELPLLRPSGFASATSPRPSAPAAPPSSSNSSGGYARGVAEGASRSPGEGAGELPRRKLF